MKKLVILALVASLVAGVAFAQELNISGYYRVGGDLIGGDSHDHSKTGYTGNGSSLGAGVTDTRGRLDFSAVNEGETFGGFIRLQPEASTLDQLQNFGILDVLKNAWVWWQPIKQVKLQAGLLDDFYVTDIVDDPFGGNAEETQVHYAGVYSALSIDALSQEFAQGGVAVSILPVEGLAINIGIPLLNGYIGGFEDYKIKDVYIGKGPETGLLAQVTFDLNNIGRIAAAFRANAGGGEWDKTDPLNPELIEYNGGAIYAGFYLTAIEKVGLNIGVKFGLPTTYEVVSITDPIPKHTYTEGLTLGLGFKLDLEPFAVAARFGMNMLSSTKVGNTVTDGALTLGIQLLPSFDLGLFKVFINLGLDLWAHKDVDDPEIGFYVNPYVEKTIGGGSFFAGFKLYTKPHDPDTSRSQVNGRYPALLYWSIPCGMKFAF
ncbi:MAG: hypothetical protein LBQ69_05905 [Treponema sp.]|nr:hypothetical protein [Treponema sp.]